MAAAESKTGPPGAPKAWCLDANCTALNWQGVPTGTFLHFSLKASKVVKKRQLLPSDCFFCLLPHPPFRKGQKTLSIALCRIGVEEEGRKNDQARVLFELSSHCKSGFNFILNLPLQEWLSWSSCHCKSGFNFIVNLPLQEWLSWSSCHCKSGFPLQFSGGSKAQR